MSNKREKTNEDNEYNVFLCFCLSIIDLDTVFVGGPLVYAKQYF
jgi:hypothetical protein